MNHWSKVDILKMVYIDPGGVMGRINTFSRVIETFGSTEGKFNSLYV